MTMMLLLWRFVVSATAVVSALCSPTPTTPSVRLEAVSLEALGMGRVVSLLQERCESKVGRAAVSARPCVVREISEADVAYGCVKEAYESDLVGVDGRLDLDSRLDDDDIRSALSGARTPWTP